MTPKPNTAPIHTRSEGSLAFEAHWRSLPREGLVPAHASFNPARAGQFLSNIILVEAPDTERRALRFRLVGHDLAEQVGHNVAGSDYLDFIPKEQHAEALEAARLICTHPCGIWQINPVHFERGITRFIEATIFPLGARADGIALMLGKLEFLDDPAKPGRSPRKAEGAETSSTFAFIDIGAGLPVWTL